jgi:hypothetical protein
LSKSRSLGILLATAVSLVGAVAAAAALIIQNFFMERFSRFGGNFNGTRAFNATRTFAGSRFAGEFGFVGSLATTAYVCVIIVTVILVAVVCSEKFGSKATSS